MIGEARRAAEAGSMDALKASGAFDELMAQVDSGQLERGLQAELSGYLGYDKGDPIGRFLPNSRNGSYPKTLGTSAGDVDLAVPRDRDGVVHPAPGTERCPPHRGSGGHDHQPLRRRDIAHRLESALGTEFSHETISKITDAVLDEAIELQKRPLEPLYPILYLDAIVVKVRSGHQVR